MDKGLFARMLSGRHMLILVWRGRQKKECYLSLHEHLVSVIELNHDFSDAIILR